MQTRREAGALLIGGRVGGAPIRCVQTGESEHGGNIQRGVCARARRATWFCAARCARASAVRGRLVKSKGACVQSRVYICARGPVVRLFLRAWGESKGVDSAPPLNTPPAQGRAASTSTGACPPSRPSSVHVVVDVAVGPRQLHLDRPALRVLQRKRVLQAPVAHDVGDGDAHAPDEAVGEARLGGARG